MLNNYKSHIAFKNTPTGYIPNPLHSTIFDFNEKIECILSKHVFNENKLINIEKKKKNITKKKSSKKN